MVPNGFTLLLMIHSSYSVIVEQLVPAFSTHLTTEEIYIDAGFISDLQQVVYPILAEKGTQYLMLTIIWK